MSLLARFVFGALLVILCSCASPSAPTLVLPTASPARTISPTSAFVEATPDAPLDVHGTFVFAAGDGSLWLQDARGGDPNPFVERSTEYIAQMPAYAPDGKTIAFAALLFLPNSALRGDIHALDADGKNARVLVHAAQDETVYLYPRFARDGRLLVTHAENLQTTNERAWLEWVNGNGDGKQTRVIENARDGDVSPNGAKIAFVRYDVGTMRYALWLANADGTAAQELVNAEMFTAILNPRFSPDGKWLAFGVHGAPQKNLPRARANSSRACAVPVLIFCFAQRASAHAAPGALWRVHLETKKFQQLTDIYDDSPTPAWSRDGTHIAIHDFTGIRLIDVTREKIYPLFLEDGGNGGFDWFEK
jgi:Tol biopolymer transport system component